MRFDAWPVHDYVCAIPRIAERKNPATGPLLLAAGSDSIAAPAAREDAMAKLDPMQFSQEVRSEANKVSWPSRKETLITTAMVFVMVLVASIFFVLADQVVRWLVATILGFGR